jgi:exonuclease SbcC
MRLHHLEATAFGPFADTVTVDFDRLSDSGLFLLSGPTGAGKTSVLDAVCFALYGDVPGDRAAAKRLRCDQAAPGVAPRVVLEATIGGRRFRLTRSPAWERPKKRGTGMTTQQASVVLAERIGDEWTTLSTRLDETGHLVGDLVGMTLTQFTQVVMLPQGRFQAFLRAKSEERHALLQQLFRTGRFEAVERWLRDRRVALRRQADSAHRVLADAVSRVSEVTATPLPEAWSLHDLAEPATSGELEAWAEERAASVATRADEARRRAAAAASAEARARTALEAARAAAERRRRRTAAAQELASLDADAEQHAACLGRIDAARRAATVAPLSRLCQQATRAHAQAQAALPRDADREQLEGVLSEAMAGAARVEALRPRADRLHAVTRRLTALAAREDELDREEARLRTEAERLVTRLTEQLDSARAAHAEARDHALTMRDRALDVRAARLDGMAAELAGAIASGGCCPVCGSSEHPHRAAPAPGAPGPDDERAAQKDLDDAKALEHLRDTEVRDLATRLEAAEERLAQPEDPGLAAARAELLASRDALDAEAEELRAVLDGVSGADLDALLETERRREREARAALRAMDTTEAAQAELDRARRALADAVSEAGFDDEGQARDAELAPGALDDLEARVRDHDRRRAAAESVFAEPVPDGDSAQPDPDALAQEHAALLTGLREATADQSLWEGRSARLTGLADELLAALGAWRPLCDELTLTAGLSSFVEGKAADNRLQMRLSAYVLAYRLGQVVAAANERLARMSDQRYSLEHTGRRGAGESRGGLSLAVRDDWSGEARDPATLSGGETFVVSLALALGLADVIGEESGGAQLDTLFVDEGFGSLDADTLDDVMDTLDSLRDGGRVVGVVSHVAEMRDRIPTQLLVAKSRRGSTLSITGG